TLKADYRLGGNITSIRSRSARTGLEQGAIFITFEMFDLETSEIVRSNMYEMSKASADDVTYRRAEGKSSQEAEKKTTGGKQMPSMGKYILLAATALSLSACVTTRENEASVPETQLREYLADKPKELHKHFAVNLMQGQRNQALNSMRLGLATLEMGNDQLATELFESALGVIETVYADNEAAKAARSVFTKETVK